MTKKKSKCLFIVFAIILVVCLIASFVNFTYPFAINGNYYSYSNFVSNIKLGDDISNSLRIIYRTKVPEGESSTNYSELKSSTMADLKAIVQSEGYKDVTVTEYGEEFICIQVGNIFNIDDENSILNLIGSPEAIRFSTDSEGKDVFATGKHIKRVVAGSGVGTDGSKGYSVAIEFKDEYKEMVEEKAPANEDYSETSKSIYVSLGEEQFEWKYGIPNGILQLSSSSFTSELDAQTYANKIRTGMLALELTNVTNANIAPSYGMGANIILPIIIALLVISAFVYLIVKYRHMGWIACFNMLFYIVIGLFLLQSIPLVHVNFAGMIALMVCIILAIDGLMSIIESAKKHYQQDKKLYIAFKIAMKENLTKIIFSNVLVCLTGFICLFMPSLSIQSFGWVAFVLSFVSVFCSLVLMKLFIKMYMALNNTDGKKCNFHKGGKNA